MPDFFVPVTPRNFRTDWGSTEVTGDVYRICEQVAELSPNLMIRDRAQDAATNGGYRYVVSEISQDGVERWVLGTDALDGRLTTRLQQMLNVPFEDRYRHAERQESAAKDAAHENELDELAERIGLPMLTDLERCGFTQRRTSYAKAGHVGGRGSLRRG